MDYFSRNMERNGEITYKNKVEILYKCGVHYGRMGLKVRTNKRILHKR